MGDYRPQFPSANSQAGGEQFGDPFADRPRQTHFTEPERPYHNSPSPGPRAFESTTTLPQEFGAGDNYDDDDYIEKQPLNAGGTFTGGFYPPAYVSITMHVPQCCLTWFPQSCRSQRVWRSL